MLYPNDLPLFAPTVTKDNLQLDLHKAVPNCYVCVTWSLGS